MSETRGCETPLIELLRRVPKDARQMYEHDSAHYQNIPYGFLCHREADELTAVTAERDELRQVNREVAELLVENARRRRVLRDTRAEVERIKAEANIRGDHYAYDLMRTILATLVPEGEAEGGPR